MPLPQHRVSHPGFHSFLAVTSALCTWRCSHSAICSPAPILKCSALPPHKVCSWVSAVMPTDRSRDPTRSRCHLLALCGSHCSFQGHNVPMRAECSSSGLRRMQQAEERGLIESQSWNPLSWKGPLEATWCNLPVMSRDIHSPIRVK